MKEKEKNRSAKGAQNLTNIARTLPQEGKGRLNGSYTGTPEDGGVPVQDADDL